MHAGFIGSAAGGYHSPGVRRDTVDDTVPDVSDNCPEHANPDQADTDGDGVGDACDAVLIGTGVFDLTNGVDVGGLEVPLLRR